MSVFRPERLSIYQFLTFAVYTRPCILVWIQSLKDWCAFGRTWTFTPFVTVDSFARWPITRRMYSTEHSIPTRVEWPDGRVFGPVRRKRFGNSGTQTLGNKAVSVLLSNDPV